MDEPKLTPKPKPKPKPKPRPKPKHAIWGLAAGPLPAHHRGTRRKYVLVGSGAASMPLRVPRR
ncbi:hypothetical protein XarjCFBP7653_18025 [Xanthomonas arboricola]|nr:hypothetical protein XarjCFBP7653_18025 [Xanthomonas arboricola]